MKTVDIVFDLYCKHNDHPVRYRVYVDNDLLTERDFVWPGSQYYIEEVCVANLETGKHNIRIENLDPQHGSFTVKNVRVDNITTQTEFFI